MSDTETAVEKVTGRIAAVDTLGFVDELDKQLAKDLRTDVKVSMTGRGLELARADFFEGRLHTSRSGAIPPEKWLRLYEAGKISRKDFLLAVSIGREKAKKVLGDNDVDRITEWGDESTRLVVARIKGVEPTLVDAIRGLGLAVEQRTRSK